MYMTMMGYMFIDNRHLPAHTGTNIAHTIIITDILMLVIWERFTSLSGIHRLLGVFIRHNQRTTTEVVIILLPLKLKAVTERTTYVL